MLINSENWVLIDTETTGFIPPIWPVEIAAQPMRGFFPAGPPRTWLLNHGIDIPPNASRIHGYTRQILAANGIAPARAISEFDSLTAGFPLAAYNLEYDFDRVLAPYYYRTKRPPSLVKGFCLAGLTRGLLPGRPAGNYQLQTIAQFYTLPNSAAHTALGDVQTSLHLLDMLRPLAMARGLHSIAALAKFAALHPPARRW